MSLATRASQMLMRFLMAPIERIQQHHKSARCCTGEGVRLYGSSRILNLQSTRSAVDIGARTHVRGELLTFAHGGSISIGKDCYIGEDSRIWSAASIRVGDRVLISHCVNIHDNNAHSISASRRSRHFQQIAHAGGHPTLLEDVAAASIVIGDDAWIGFNSVILKGVTVGEGAIVGAASVVVDDIPPFMIVAGNPAKIIGHSQR